MSLILEALKKSEARRRLGEAPDIGTPFTPASRRRNPWPFIVISVAVIVAAGWWYVHSSTALAPPPMTATVPPAAGNLQRPAGIATPSTNVAVKPSASSARLGAGADAASTQRTAPSQQTMQPARPTPVPGAANPVALITPTQRTASANSNGPALASTVKPLGDKSQGTSQVNRTSANPALRTTPPANDAVANPATAKAPAPAASSALPASTSNAPANRPFTPPTASIASATTATPAAAPPSTPATATASAAETLPQYYELPLSLRRDLPQIAFSMHVYSTDPKQRFVVVDGERKGEGDTLKDDVMLHEIRADGLVLEFRGQRFFYPRNGH